MNKSAIDKTQRSEEEWNALFSEYQSSGLSKKKFCEQKSIKPSSFYSRLNKKKARNKSSAKFLDIPSLKQPAKDDPATSEQRVTVELSLPHGSILRLSY